MITVLGLDCTKPSGPKLAEELGAKYEQNSLKVVDNNQDVLIRWGHSYGNDIKNTLNRAEAISQNCEKHESISIMNDVVKTPKIYMGRIPEGRRAVVRSYHHAEGSDFQVKTGPFRLAPGQFGAQFIDTPTEYRFWFCGDRVMTGRRVPILPEHNGPCRSKWGYEFESTTAMQKRQTFAAAKAIGLDFGAADVLWSDRDDCYYFLELNSAPSLDTPTVLSFFTTGIKDLIKSRFGTTERRSGSDRRVTRVSAIA